MTLLELTVVILVLLSLISILFIGARAWKKGSDRSANIMNLRNTQQAMRGHQNMKELAAADVFTETELTQYMKMPKSISPGATDAVTYTPKNVITPQSAVPATNYDHIWLTPSATGLPGSVVIAANGTKSGTPSADYGQDGFGDSTGW